MTDWQSQLTEGERNELAAINGLQRKLSQQKRRIYDRCRKRSKKDQK